MNVQAEKTIELTDKLLTQLKEVRDNFNNDYIPNARIYYDEVTELAADLQNLINKTKTINTRCKNIIC